MNPADLRTARKTLGLTQKGLAEALRMGKHGWQTISKWERDDFDGAIPGPVTLALECLINHSDRARPLQSWQLYTLASSFMALSDSGQADIEITPAMLYAAETALCRHSFEDWDQSEAGARAVLEAVLRSALSARQSPE